MECRERRCTACAGPLSHNPAALKVERQCANEVGGERATDLEMRESLLREGLVLAESLQDDRVRALAEELDLAVRAPHDGRHALPRRVELADVEDLVLEALAVDVHEHRLWLALHSPELRIDL